MRPFLVLFYVLRLSHMQFDIITIFPRIFDSYFSESIVGRAQKGGLIGIKIRNLRDWAKDKHKTVDDTPYGGGPGMVMKVEPIYKCVNSIKNSKKNRIILFSAKGKKYTQRDAERLKKYDNLILICGRYEGVDERVAKYVADEEISIGDFVLTGGEIPAMILVDSIIRLLPGVLGNPKSIEEESFRDIQNPKFLPTGQAGKIKNSYLEYPQYTKPEEFGKWKVPKVLLSGNHKEIEEWRKEHSKLKSQSPNPNVKKNPKS